MFRTVCDSASITAVASKWRPYSFISNRANRKVRWWRRKWCCFRSIIPWWKRKFETVRCRYAAATSFVAKVRREVFTHFHLAAVKRRSSMRNWLVDLSKWIFCEQSTLMWTEPPTGYPIRYQSNNLINRIAVVTNNRNSTGIVTSRFYIWFASRQQQKYTSKTLQSARCLSPVNTYISRSAVRVFARHVL
jgi:hypothetical protein